MTAGACWDFIAEHGLVLQSSLFILQVLQRWNHTYTEKSHTWHKILFFFLFFLTVLSVLVLVPRNTYFSARQWNKIASHNFFNSGQRAALRWLLCLSPGPNPQRDVPAPEHLGRYLDLLVRGIEMGSSVSPGTHCWNLKCLGAWWIFWLLIFILFYFV